MTSRKQLICLVVGSLLLSTGQGATAQQDEAKPKTPPTRLPSSPLPLRPVPKAVPKAESTAKPAAEQSEELKEELPQFDTEVQLNPLTPRTRRQLTLDGA